MNNRRFFHSVLLVTLIIFLVQVVDNTVLALVSILGDRIFSGLIFLAGAAFIIVFIASAGPKR